MDTSEILEALETYFEAFAEKDAAGRGQLLAGRLTPAAAILGKARSAGTAG